MSDVADDWESVLDDETTATPPPQQQKQPQQQPAKSSSTSKTSASQSHATSSSSSSNSSSNSTAAWPDDDNHSADAFAMPAMKSELLDMMSGAAQAKPVQHDSILELYCIPEHFKTADLERLVGPYNHSHIKWFSDTQAFVVFSTPYAVEQILANFAHSTVKLRPISKSDPKTAQHIRSLFPDRAALPLRPEKDATVAKRLIANVIGVPQRIRTPEERQRDKEAEQQRKAKRQDFLQQQQQKQAAWDE
ncbi:hypothetical protein CAOG_00176 [Capsaspora owczarzaki ATCC 30864]|uniref:R3H domain-containing protein n=1 Tax=Capsaspora owczarzaki (strain ATCC 30864) TaxID=595528 RepID=A0A0D2X068_CAPO3|nr:hypothetical protein CAOG_00176 [Capsaspora owczarzaki ATCC 30864]KJE88534.1 hypothetical protein CAOG_000176 [Capsaspora owczarzaki ATCC 30864]|eukprot:XP_004365047.1 hypothetical protein CAOG_00176 [Capsaspora owczarzaki ATCC 30864]